MPRIEELQTARVVATTVEADLGNKIAQNFRRYIYRVKVINRHKGPNELTFGDRLGVAAMTTADTYQMVTQHETQVDPDEIKKDSLPIYVIQGSTATADRLLRVVTNNGDADILVQYVDAP